MIGGSEILEVAHRLERLVEGADDRVAVSVETDLDEAFFVGTSTALVRLAAALLRAAASDAPKQEVAGIGCRWSAHTHGVADPLAPIVAGAECVVPTDDERRQVVDHFRTIDGDE